VRRAVAPRRPSAGDQREQPVVARLGDFNQRSGSPAERLIFTNRLALLLLCALVTLLLAVQATALRLNAGFERMIPTGHPYIKNYLRNKDALRGQGNAVRVAVETRAGTIFSAEYLETLKRINDEVFLIPGVDRAQMKSLWTPNTRWLAVTEDGLDGGSVIPDSYDGTAASVEQVRTNVEHSGEVGQLVAGIYRSSVLAVPLVDAASSAGEAIDYRAFSRALEHVRQKYESDSIAIHITGFAKLVGDLIDGLAVVVLFFAAAVVIAAVMVFGFTRCARSTMLVVACSLTAVVWQLGLLRTLHYDLDPYSILVPFLVFAIGMSHGVQKMNGIMQDIGRGTHKLVAARYTFRRLFVAGLTALLADAVGFAVLLLIPIGVIRELAIGASIGVAGLIFTNLVLLPILLSYVGVSEAAARRSVRIDAAAGGAAPLWTLFDRFTDRRWATAVIVSAAALGVAGLYVSRDLKVGDLDEGAPELRPGSRYNRDNAFMTANYGAGSDVLVVMVKTPAYGCATYDTLSLADALELELQELDGVESTNSLATLSKKMIAGMNEGSPKWYELIANQSVLNAVTTRAPRELFNQTCDTLLVFAFLRDHKADTLNRVVEKVEEFAARNDSKERTILLAAGNAGIEAATNIVVKSASREMLLLVYGAVVLLCLAAFRSWRAVTVAVVPLLLTSVLAEALMVRLGMGVKVATLPVIALGVGIGVDYALYILSVTMARLRAGATLAEAYAGALKFTGKVVLLTGLTLSIGVATWALSPLKFQADMGVMLAFMFLWNMLGALVLIPALACWLTPSSRTKAAGALPATTSL